MNITMQSSATPDLLTHKRWAVGIVGPSVDDRGGATTDFVRAHADEILTLRYDVSQVGLTLGDASAPADGFNDVFARVRSPVILDATTLGFVEVLLCCRAVKELELSLLTFLYAEPGGYQGSRLSRVLHRRDFELSEVVEQFSGVPGNVILLREDTPVRAVFLLGYEGQRLAQALEQTEIRSENCSVVFGVPAFQPGWEMDSYANNVRVIRERQLPRSVLFAAAQNPAAAYAAIDRVYTSLRPLERLVVVPIGTKPHGVGAALFACDHPDVGVLYDHPKRRQKRTEKLGTWHLYSVSFPGPA